MAKSTEWGSRIGFILASAGSAIGLGAIWKFPFWAGANGGGNFIIPYIIFTFTIGVALLMAEASVGRAGRGSAVQAMKKMGGPFFAIAGFIGVISSFIILSYYSVVGGWCVSYLIGSLTNSAFERRGNAERGLCGSRVGSGKKCLLALLLPHPHLRRRSARR